MTLSSTPGMIDEMANLFVRTLDHVEVLRHDDQGGSGDRWRERLTQIRSAILRAREIARTLARSARPDGVDALPASEVPVGVTRPVAPPSSRPLHVLVVDDEPELVDTMKALLRRTGHVVETAVGGADALVHLATRRFDCVVTDLAMPGVNGLTVSRAARDRHPETWVVLLTGVESDRSPEELQAAGVDRVAVKPLSFAELRGLVEEARMARAS